MTIRFLCPLYITDPNVPEVFVHIINGIQTATSPSEAHRNLLLLCNRESLYCPADYFQWGFDKDKLWLQQRVVYRSEKLFKEKLLIVEDYTSPESLPINN